VAARPGLGVFRLVQTPEEALEALPPGLSDVFELRYLMETGVTELAAQRRTDEDVERMRAALLHMRGALESGGDGVADDDAFHVAVATATHNPQLERFQQFMGQQLSESRTPTWSAAGHRVGWARHAQEGHERIFAAIVAGDAVAARAAAAEHLVSAARRLGLDLARWPALGGLEDRI
jgi:GntR family transcriptional repressor for pyruvate dehydrogenase complex